LWLDHAVIKTALQVFSLMYDRASVKDERRVLDKWMIPHVQNASFVAQVNNGANVYQKICTQIAGVIAHDEEVISRSGWDQHSALTIEHP